MPQLCSIPEKVQNHGFGWQILLLCPDIFWFIIQGFCVNKNRVHTFHFSFTLKLWQNKKSQTKLGPSNFVRALVQYRNSGHERSL